MTHIYKVFTRNSQSTLKGLTEICIVQYIEYITLSFIQYTKIVIESKILFKWSNVPFQFLLNLLCNSKIKPLKLYQIYQQMVNPVMWSYLVSVDRIRPTACMLMSTLPCLMVQIQRWWYR